MDAKDFIFPGVILALVVIISLGLLFTHSDRPQPLPTPVATTTDTVATSSEVASAPSTPRPSAHAYGSVTLALGQAVSFDDTLTLRPMHVLEDSRCPKDVECIQAGTVKITLAVTMNGKTANQTISIGQSIHAGSDTITLDSVVPEKSKGGYPAASSYRFTLTVTHG